jgi:hypothetical protein
LVQRLAAAPVDFGNKKNLTAEVAENAEVEMAKCPGTGCKEKRGPIFHPSRKINTANGFYKERSLPSLRLSSLSSIQED